MASASVEILELDYRFLGMDQVARAQAEIKKLADRIDYLDSMAKKGTITDKQAAAVKDQLSAKVNNATAALDRYQTAAAGAAGATGGRGSQGGRGSRGGANLGMAALTAGHALQDLNYGLSAVMNNLPMLISQLGGPAGLAGIIAVLGAAYIFLAPQIDEFTKSLKTEPVAAYATEIDRLKASLEKLTEKPVKLAVEFEEQQRLEREIERLQKLTGAGKQVIGSSSPEQEAFADAVGGAMAGSGEEIRNLLQDQIGKELVGADLREMGAQVGDPEMKSLIAREKKLEAELRDVHAMSKFDTSGGSAMAERRISKELGSVTDQIESRAGALRTTIADERATQMIGAATQGPEGLEALIERLETVGAPQQVINDLLGALPGYGSDAQVTGVGERVRDPEARALAEQGMQSQREYERAQAVAQEAFSRPGVRDLARTRLVDEGQSPEQVAEGLRRSLFADVPEDIGTNLATDFVRQLSKEETGKKIAEAIAYDPEQGRRDELGLMSMQAARMSEGFDAVQSVGAESFAEQVQSQQGTMGDHFQKLIDAELKMLDETKAQTKVMENTQKAIDRLNLGLT